MDSTHISMASLIYITLKKGWNIINQWKLQYIAHLTLNIFHLNDINKTLQRSNFLNVDFAKAVNAWVQSAFGNLLSSDEKNIGHYAA